jgi:hypothetical protein
MRRVLVMAAAVASAALLFGVGAAVGGVSQVAAGTGSGQPASNSVYGRITGLDFGTGFLYRAAPSGVAAAAVESNNTNSEELSATKALTLKNLHVSLVVPVQNGNLLTDGPDPVPPGFRVDLIFFSPGVVFTNPDCFVTGGSSTCAVATVGTLPAGNLLHLDIVPGFPVQPGYTPDAIFTYQAVPQ